MSAEKSATDKLAFGRGSGVLLHPTSFPGPHESGDLGGAANFIVWLERAGQRYWQVLPLAPTGYGDSPYSAMSAFAMNPLIIDLEDLVSRGWLAHSESTTRAARWNRLREASVKFSESGSYDSFDAFCHDQSTWLDDYALFMALNSHFHGREWTGWPEALAGRDATALHRARKELAADVRLHQFTQWICAEQWRAVRERAKAAGIQIIGDLPIFVAFQSAEVWANRELFHLNSHGQPTVVAGVPPDYFSKTGQRWGNPLYRWDVLKERGYDFWIARFRSAMEQVDIVRVDHFRGFAACWEIPASEPTAVKGRWVPGPEAAVFEAVHAALGEIRIVAEDLGVITPDVVALRDQFGFPGMKILQFAFDSGPKNAFLPHNHVANCIVYTGTHDNDTTLGWYRAAPEAELDYARRYCATDGRDFNWDLIHLAFASVANVAVYPLQDVLGLGSDSRMNTPGKAAGNWHWRFAQGDLTADLATRLRGLADIYGRLPAPLP